jgi:hypothetical protein
VVPIHLLAGVGFAWGIGWGRTFLRRAAWVVALVAVAVLGVENGYHLFMPRSKAHVRPAIEYVDAHRQPGDWICVVGGETSINYFAYHMHQVDAQTELNVLPTTPLPSGRFWLVFGGEPDHLTREMQPMLDHALATAVERDSFRTRGGAAYLFQAKPAATQTGAASR